MPPYRDFDAFRRAVAGKIAQTGFRYALDERNSHQVAEVLHPADDACPDKEWHRATACLKIGA